MLLKNNLPKSTQKTGMSFVFLSLVLILLCFFIFLFSVSSFEQSKVKAVGRSFQKAFSIPANTDATEPLYELNAVQIVHQEQIKKMFPDSFLTQNANGILVSFNADDIFKQGTAELTNTADVWGNQIKSLTALSFLKNKYTQEIMFFEDLKNSEDFPVFPHLTTARIKAITHKMDTLGITDYRLRITKGNASRLVLFFQRKVN